MIRRAPGFVRSAPWFLGLFLVALVAFWPTYLSQVGAHTACTCTALTLIDPIVVRPMLPAMLAVFMRAQLPALAGWTGSAPWQGFARWFEALTLT